MKKIKKEPIAIIGVGCRFPGDSNSPEEFWSFLKEAKDAVGKIPPDRWDADAYYHPDYKVKGKISVKWGGYIKDIDKFDAQFFSIPPMEALRLDPQQRLLMETSYLALEDAGLDIEKLSNKKVGVFIGLSGVDYHDICFMPTEHIYIDGKTISGGAASIASNRLSYIYNFRGPSLTIDTACSSSLIAGHYACTSIWQGDCEMALLGGVNLLLKPEITMSFSKGGFLSPDGLCKTFDEDADGYIRSEGTGIVVLKKLSKAIEDGDRIYATIIGSAANHDGLTDGLSMPGQDAQIQVFSEAIEDADIDPSLVQYIEAHGTGTTVGDPIEATSIGIAVGSKKKNGEKLYIGSVKSNIGHLEPASGMAGLIKLALAMKNRKIPQNIHFNKPNPKIDFEKYKLKVPTKMIDWPMNGSKEMYAGINSFGFGGANAHLVLKGYTEANHKTKKKEEEDKKARLFLVSARGTDALRNQVQNYINYIKKNLNNPQVSLYDICYTSSVRRTHHYQRLAFVVHSKEELIENLEAYLNDETRPGMSSAKVNLSDNTKKKVAFVCSGQGPQWWGMARELLEKNEIFRETVEKCDKEISKYADWSLLEEMRKDEKNSRISETNIAQPSLFAVQVGLYKIWQSFGIEAEAVVGHSIGEVAAAYISGMMSFEEACKVIYYRSNVQNKASGKGKMLAVGLTGDEAEKLIIGNEDKVSVATINGPNLVTLSGEEEVLKKIAEDLDSKDIFHKFLVVNVPFHSPYMEPLKDELIEALSNIELKKTDIPLYSTVTGNKVEDFVYDGEYWFKNVRNTVRFTNAITEMVRDGYNTFIEITAHPILSRYLNEILDKEGKKGIVVGSIRRKEEDMLNILASLGKLHTKGYPLDWNTIYKDRGEFIDLPLYPFQRESFWIETDISRKIRMGRKTHPFIKSHTETASNKNNHCWNINLDKRLIPFIEDHRVQGPIIFPGAGSTELSLACAIDSFKDDFCFLEDISFEKAIFLPDEGDPPEIQFNVSNHDGSFQINTRKKGEEWKKHVSGKIRHLEEKFNHEEISIEEMKKVITEPVNVEWLYEQLYESGLQLGESFRGINRLWRASRDNEYIGEALGEIIVPEVIRQGIEEYNIHPAVLDACFQSLFGVETLQDEQKIGVMVPVNIKRFKFYKKPSLKLYTYGHVTERNEMFVLGNIWIFDEKGNLCIEMQGFKCRYIEGTRGEDKNVFDKTLYKWDWILKERESDKIYRNPKDYIYSPASIKDFAIELEKEMMNRSERLVFDDFELELNKITVYAIAENFKKLGFEFEKGKSFNTKEFIENYNIADKNQKLVGRLIEILNESGYLEKKNDDNWTVIKTFEEKDIDKFQKDLLKKYPEFFHEMNMLGRCTPSLDKVLIGEIDGVQLLFPDEEWENIVKYYQEGSSFSRYNEIVQRSIQKLIRDLPQDQTLRILEIGAGTGGMTNSVLPILPDDRTEYVFTDISHMFLQKAEERYGSKYPFINFKFMDITKDLKEQGIDPNSFDIVIASDVIHATPSAKKTLTNAQKLLAPNGIFVMLEVTQCPWYSDLVFGLTEGWWMYEDYDLRPNHATMRADKWTDILTDLGFSDVLTVTDTKKEGSSGQTVFIAKNRDFEVKEEEIKLPPKFSEKGNWVIFKDGKGIGKRLINFLEKQNQECFTIEAGKEYKSEGNNFTIDPVKQEDMDKVFEEIMSNSNELYGILHLWNLDHPDTEELKTEDIENTISTGSSSILNMLRTLKLSAGKKVNFHLWAITSAAQHTPNFETISMAQTPVWGLGRVCIHEYQNLGQTYLDLSKNPSDEELKSLIKEISQEEQMEEIALRGKARYLHKLVRITEEDDIRASMSKVKAKDSVFHLITKEQGILENLALQEMKRKKPGKDEVEIYPLAVGINFKDVMIAMGLLDEEAPKGGFTGKNFGMECAGKIVSVGDNVKDLKVGDEVIAISPDSFSSSVVTRKEFAVKKPSDISFEQAATIPFAYITAYYSIVYLARMRKGERILIHSATGGVGLAAVRLAMEIGAEVYATVGTPEKAEFLKSLGVKHIMNSRSLEFADEIMEITNGEGVDIVLNSLSGGAIYKSISVLRKYGRFVEIGKTDIYQNNSISLRPFWNNLSYFAVDIDKLLTEKPELCGELFKEFMALFKDNNEHPPAHPYKTYKMSNVVDAFRFVASAKHIGKVVVKNEEEDELLLRPSDDIKTMIKQDATYIVTGGFSGLGLATTEWLMNNGAKNLTVISRSGAKKDEAKEFIERAKKENVNVYEAKADSTDLEAMKKVFEEMRKNMPPIRGIIHSAMVLDDAILEDMTHDRFMTAVRPKVAGLWNLHQLSKDDPVDFFVSYSSVSGEYGSPAQSNYGAGSVFLDMFSYYRKKKGLSASTISWGVISEVGFVARNKAVSDILETQGWRAFSPNKAMNLLGKIILRQPTHRMGLDVDWKAVSVYFPKDKSSHRFSHLLTEDENKKKSEGESLKELLFETEESKREEVLQKHLAERVARILGTSASKLDMEYPISNMGLDSLMANQLRNWINIKLDVDFSMMKIIRGPSIIELSKQLLGEVKEDEPVADEKEKGQGKWFLNIKERKDAKLRLFCFPYMGGGASAFLSWGDKMSEDIEVLAVQYPGRENRINEEAIDDVEVLVEKLAKEMLPLLDKPFAFYGHSIGAGVCFKLAHYLKEHYNKVPVKLFVGGWIAPHLRSPFKIIADLSESEIKSEVGRPHIFKHLRNLEIEESTLTNTKLMEEMMPSIKADILLGKRYRYKETKPLPCPIVAFAGKNDSVFTLDQVKAWEKHTDKNFDFHIVNGGHIFIRDNKDTVTNQIQANLKDIVIK